MKTLQILLICFLITVGNSYTQDKDYQIPEIDVDVQITSDGIVEITEDRTYHFTGSFSWADYRLPKRGFAEIRNIQVVEADQFFTNRNNEEIGTFSVSESDDAVIIRWNYEASDTTRTFSIRYQLIDALSAGPEWTEFFWNYLASGREKATDKLDITISLPDHIPSDSLHVWIRTASNQTNIQKSPGTFIISAENITRDQSFRVRSLFPTSVFDQNAVTVTDTDLTLSQVQREEQSYLREQREKAERQAYFQSITPEAVVMISVFSIAIFIIIYRKYGKRPSVGAISDRDTIMIPDSSRPALIGRLFMNNSTTGRHLAATLFDLARRGWFTIKEEKKEKSGYFSSESTQFRIRKTNNQPGSELTDWEKMLTEHINRQIDAGHDLFEEVFKKGDFKMSKWFSEWKKKVESDFDEKNWIDKESYKGILINILVQSALLIASIALLIAGESKISFFAFIVTISMIIASAAIFRRTSEGQEKYIRWKAYRKGLKNADKRTIRMEILDRHFIYALALHLNENQIENVIKSVDNGGESVFPWIILMAGSNTTPASIASSVTTMASTSTSTFPGTAGGVGASVGSAGGGASGGAG